MEVKALPYKGRRVEMRYKPERALTHNSFSLSGTIALVEMRYKPERALTRKLLTQHRSRDVKVEMRYKPDHIGARPCVQLRACNPK